MDLLIWPHQFRISFDPVVCKERNFSMDKRIKGILKKRFRERLFLEFPNFGKVRPDIFLPKNIFSGVDFYEADFEKRMGFIALDTLTGKSNEYVVSIYWNEGKGPYARRTLPQNLLVWDKILANGSRIPSDIKHGCVDLLPLLGKNHNWQSVEISSGDLDNEDMCKKAVESAVDFCMKEIKDAVIPFLNS